MMCINGGCVSGFEVVLLVLSSLMCRLRYSSIRMSSSIPPVNNSEYSLKLIKMMLAIVLLVVVGKG